MKREAGHLIRKAANWYDTDTAFVYEDQELSFEEVNNRANKIGSELLKQGLSHGDRVGLLAYNAPETVECWFGMEKHELVRTVLHTHIDIEDNAELLRNVGARAVIFDVDFSEDVASVRNELPGVTLYVGIGDETEVPNFAVPYQDIVAAGTSEEPRRQVDEDTPVHIQSTSGTTGTPKPWTETYRSWQFVVETNHTYLNTGYDDSFTRDEINLHFHPLQWAAGYQTLFPYFIHGSKSILINDKNFKPGQILQTIEEEGVTATFAPAPQLIELMESPAVSEYDYSSLKRISTMFANKNIINKAQSIFGDIILHGFGSSEMGAEVAALTPNEFNKYLGTDQEERCNSVGRPATPFIDIKIVDDEGNELLPGEIGEIVVRSPMSSTYYWDSPELTSEAFLEGDWFRPEDLGYMDENGYLYYVDRLKDRIEVEAGYVYPHEIEHTILEHEEIKDVGVIGTETAEGTEVLAVIEPGDTPSDGLSDEIQNLSEDHLESHEVPDQIEYIDEMPTVLGGSKVQRGELREQFS